MADQQASVNTSGTRTRTRQIITREVNTVAAPEDSLFSIGFCADRNFRFRRTMEDAHHFEYDFGGQKDCGYFAIFDGHAGKSAAVFCAAELHKILLEVINENGKDDSMTELMARAFEKIDDKMAANDQISSGCTAVVSVLKNDGGILKLYTANVGDARAVLSVNSKAVCLTVDHKATDPNEAARIFEQGGVVINGRVNAVLAVTRALGDHRMKDVISGKPYTTETLVTANEDVLILACDGVWDVLTDQEALDIVRSCPDPQNAAETLVNMSIEKGSQDNISVMVVKFNHQKSKISKELADELNVSETEHKLNEIEIKN